MVGEVILHRDGFFNSLLEKGFTGELAQKLLAYIDEIKMDSSRSWERSEEFKSIVSEDWRTVNPKCERSYLNPCLISPNPLKIMR